MTQPLRLSPISIPSNPTTTTIDTSTPPKTLPPLPYTPSDHKRSIALTWTIVVTNSCLLPIALVYGLWYGTSLSKNTVFGIATGVFGTLSLVQFWWRMWKLLKTDGEFRPLGSRRGWLDFYQINTMLSILIVAVGQSSFPLFQFDEFTIDEGSRPSSPSAHPAPQSPYPSSPRPPPSSSSSFPSNFSSPSSPTPLSASPLSLAAHRPGRGCTRSWKM